MGRRRSVLGEKVKYIVVDIDGTIAQVGDRLKCLETKDWDTFYARCSEDTPIKPIIDLVKMLAETYCIIFLSGRRESCRVDTTKWLGEQGFFHYHLLLRGDKDHRHDTVAKPEKLLDYLGSYDDVGYVLEDRDSVVEKWRELGLTCLQVAKGDF